MSYRRVSLALLIASLISPSGGGVLAASPTNQKPNVDKATAEKNIKDAFSQIPRLKFAKALPDNFPAPAYPNNVTKTFFSNSTSGTPTAAATIQTKDAPNVVSDWYQNALEKSGWKTQVPSAKLAKTISKNLELYVIRGNKNGSSISVVCTENKTAGGTNVCISWAK